MSVGAAALCATARAQKSELPRSLVVETLGAEKPFAFTPAGADFDGRDFALDTLDNDGVPVEASLQPDSLQWVRVARLLLVPRAMLQVRVVGAAAGVVSYAGFSHPMTIDKGSAHVEVPVALLSGTAYPIHIQVVQRGTTHNATLAVRFSPRPALRGRVIVDSSCSPYGVHAAHGQIPDDSWLYVGCRVVRTERQDSTAATLELYALWDQAGPGVRVDGMPTTPEVDSLYTYRVAFDTRVQLTARSRTIALAYALPERLHNGFLGLGLGPYAYSLHDGGASLNAIVPFVTLYAGYSFTPTARLVYFNATALHRKGSIDQGLYIWFEQFRMVDDRVSLNFLLGANVLVYSHNDQITGRLSVPQGFELLVRDLFARNRNLTLGAFLYPKIAGRSYYNAWLRWGSPSFFGELNYIEWQEPHAGGDTRSRAIGISFGTPVMRFW